MDLDDGERERLQVEWGNFTPPPAEDAKQKKEQPPKCGTQITQHFDAENLPSD